MGLHNARRTPVFLLVTAFMALTSCRGDQNADDSDGADSAGNGGASAGAGGRAATGGTGGTGAPAGNGGVGANTAGVGGTTATGGNAAGAGGKVSSGGNTAGVNGGGGSAGGATAMTGGQGNPSRPAIANAALWLESDDGIQQTGNKISRWQDTSGNANHADQSSATLAPTFVPQAWQQLPAARFAGKTAANYLRIKDAPTLNFGTGDWHIFMVLAFDNPLDGSHNGALGGFYGKQAKPEIFFCGNWPTSETVEKASLHIGLGEGKPGLESVRKDLNDGKPRLYAARRVGTELELRINGQSDSKRDGVSGSLDSVGVDTFIGTFSSGALRPLKGDVFAVVVVKGSLANAQLEALESYLTTKYKVAP